MISILGDGNVKRQDMLRHTEFYQFPRMGFGRATSPHELHWAMRDLLQDCGATVDKEVEATQLDHWTMTQDSHVGSQKGCESDYVTFSGSLVASKGQHPPRWMPLAIMGLGFMAFMSFSAFESLALFAVFALAAAVLAGVVYWIRTYAQGKVYAVYEGTYKRPESGAHLADGVVNWEVELDVMLSYNVSVPPFGLPALGPEVVLPVFSAAQDQFAEYAAGISGVRSQPQLLSRLSTDFDKRFPVKRNGE